MAIKQDKEKGEGNLASCWVCFEEGEVSSSSLSSPSSSSSPSRRQANNNNNNNNSNHQQQDNDNDNDNDKLDNDNNNDDKLVRGCACRGPTAGFAHLRCLIEAAIKHNADTWDTCPTCIQDFTGDVRLGLARARWKIACDSDLPREDGERLNAADRLAQSLQVCLGDHAGALPLFEEVLAVSRRVDGNDDVNTLISMSNLASLHQKMGNHHLALPLFEEALAAQQQRKPNGKEAQDTLLTVSNLAMLHLRTERFSSSLPLAEKALAGRRRTLGKEHADTLESIHNLGLLRWHMAHGKYVSFTNAAAHQGTCDATELETAKEFLADGLKGRRKVFGEAHYLTKESERALKHANEKLAEIQRNNNKAGEGEGDGEGEAGESKEIISPPAKKKRRLETAKKKKKKK